MKNKAVKGLLRLMIIMAVIFDIWIMVSWIDTINNNVYANPKYWKYNIFEMIVEDYNNSK